MDQTVLEVTEITMLALGCRIAGNDEVVGSISTSYTKICQQPSEIKAS